MPTPPVSTISTVRSASVQRTPTRSRVTPGVGSTIETRLRVKALSIVDLPTLGRPTIAMTGGDADGSRGIGSTTKGFSTFRRGPLCPVRSPRLPEGARRYGFDGFLDAGDMVRRW